MDDLLYGIPRSAWGKLLAVLCKQPKVKRVILFGSRAKGSHRPSSDIDLCLVADGLTLPEKLALDNVIDDLLLPWKVDLSVWGWIDTPALHDHIQRVGIDLNCQTSRS